MFLAWLAGCFHTHWQAGLQKSQGSHSQHPSGDRIPRETRVASDTIIRGTGFRPLFLRQKKKKKKATTDNFWSTVTLFGVEEETSESSFLDTYITLTLAHVHSALEG